MDSDENMMRYYPSIFNDVIGPVMRGPSSSHCAAAYRIGRFIRFLHEKGLGKIRVVYDESGSLATTHETQGSDMGLFSGLLGFEISDKRMVNYHREAEKAGLNVSIEIARLGFDNPNTYVFRFDDSSEISSLTAISTGGGMFDIIDFDGFPVSSKGDYFELFVILPKTAETTKTEIQLTLSHADDVQWIEGKFEILLQAKSQVKFAEKLLIQITNKYAPRFIRQVEPVLPVISRREIRLPFESIGEMLVLHRKTGWSLAQLAIEYEKSRSGLSEVDVRNKMMEIIRILSQSIEEGLQGTEYKDRILGYQSGAFRDGLAQGQLLDIGTLNKAILYITALMEVKSSMGLIVAAPTAGSCGTLPGTVFAATEDCDGEDTRICDALMAGGLIGIFVALNSTFSAEIGGCQAECGVASGMTAAALVTLFEGGAGKAIAAASMALQNSMGMVCDPVASRVEVPCLGKNIMAASNAIACANMALAGFDQVIPLDEVIAAFDKAGRSIPRELRCTALGGLSLTPTSKEIEKRLNKKT